MQKSKEFSAKFSKKTVFQSLHQNAGRRFYSKEKRDLAIFPTGTYLPLGFRFTGIV